MKLIENATATCVSPVIECNGPALFFVRGNFCQLALVEFEISDCPDSQFISHSVATRTSWVAINAPGKYFVRCRLSTNSALGQSNVTVSTNQGTLVESDHRTAPV